MGNSPAFQYYPADLLTDTEVMFWGMEQLGCYWQMITFLWLNDGKFEYNLEKLCKLFRVNHKKTGEKLWQNIEKKFHIKDGIVTHKRVLEEMQKQADTRLRRQEAGRKGAESRWADDSNATDLPMANDSSSTPTPITTPTSTSVIEIEKTSLGQEGLELEKKIKVEALRFIEGLDEIFPTINQDEATTFSRVAQHLQDQIRTGQKELAIFDMALEWARDAMSRNAKNPKGLFVAKVKEATGFAGKGLLLDHGQR